MIYTYIQHFVAGLSIGILTYLMIDGYMAMRERKRLDRLDEEMARKIAEGLEARRRFDEEIARIRKGA